MSVPHDSLRGRELIAAGPGWRKHPDCYRDEPPWCVQCHGHRTECAFCGYEGDGRCDDVPYPADVAALSESGRR